MGVENEDKGINTWSPSQNRGDVVLSIPHAAHEEKVFLDTPPPTPSKEDNHEGIATLTENIESTLKVEQTLGFVD